MSSPKLIEMNHNLLFHFHPKGAKYIQFQKCVVLGENK